MRRPLLAVLVALVASLGVLVAPSSPAIAADEVTVTWPAVTTFNPDSTTYAITVEDPIGSGFLVARWLDDPIQTVVGSGTTTLTFDTSGRGSVSLYRCQQPNYLDCAWVASSPWLEVFDELVTTPYGMRLRSLHGGAGPAFAVIGVDPELGDATLSATWELVDPEASGSIRATGTATPRPDPEGGSGLLVPFTIPAGLAERPHLLRIDLTASPTAFGDLAGSTHLEVPIDYTAPVIAVAGGVPTLFPARDGYLDEALFKIHTNERADLVVEVRDDDGRVVRRGPIAQRTRNTPWRFNGRGRSGILAAGRYTVVFTATDPYRNSASAARAIQVSDLKRQMVTYRRTVPAAAYLTSKYVGRCSTLSERGKALVYGSQSKCRGAKDEDSLVIARHGIYVPRAIDGRYGAFRVTVNGGPTTRSRSNYLVLGYIQGKKFTSRMVLRGGRHHPGRIAQARGLVFDRTREKPYVIWSTGLTAGSRYTVRSFTVEITYYALARPQRGRILADQPAPRTPIDDRLAASYL